MCGGWTLPSIPASAVGIPRACAEIRDRFTLSLQSRGREFPLWVSPWPQHRITGHVLPSAVCPTTLPSCPALVFSGRISKLHFLNSGILSCFLKMLALGMVQKNPCIAVSCRPGGQSYPDCGNQSWKCPKKAFEHSLGSAKEVCRCA